MKIITRTFMLFCLALSINVQAQQIIFEDFESGDPFAAANVSSEYGVADDDNCPDPNYIIGHNLNSICNFFPDVAATNPNPGHCMSTNEDGNFPANRIIYRQSGLNLNPGMHLVRFRTVQRHDEPAGLQPTNTIIDVELSNPGTAGVVQQAVVPFNNTSWTQQAVILNPTTPYSVFELIVNNPQHDGDFAIDDIDLCAVNIELTDIGPNRMCMSHDINICGVVQVCGPMDRVELRIGRDNQLHLTLDVDINPDGTFCYTSPNADELISLGLERRVFYDVVPVLILDDDNQTEIVGSSFSSGSNNDFRLSEQTEASAIMNKSLTDEVNDFNFFCKGDPIFFHGMAEESDRFHIGIWRRLIDENDYQWVGGDQQYYSFDGASYDLTTDFDFESGYEYKVVFGVMDIPNCISWTKVTKIFKVIDCCTIEPTGHSSFPYCTYKDDLFEMQVYFDEPLTEDDIDLIYSTSQNFELLSWSIITNQPPAQTIISLTFRSRGCSCEGDMLSFDIRLVGCTNNIWIMSENIPCCSSNCSDVDLEYLEFTGDCEILNGVLTYPFVGALEVAEGTEIVSITAVGTNGLCPTRIATFDYDVSNNTVNFSGTVQSLNPNCTWGDIEFIIETEEACCRLEVPMSFPQPCGLESCVTEDAPTRQSLCSGYLTFSVPGSPGSVTVTNNLTGQTTSPFITTVNCVSHISSNGTVYTYPCDGFVYNFNVNCNELENPEDANYDLTITIGRCEYRFTGNMCESLACGVSEFSGGGSERSIDQGKEIPTDFEVNIFPNPTAPGGTLTIQSTTLIREVSILDLQGRLITNQRLDESLASFNMSTPSELHPGVYVVKVVTVENETKMMRVLVINH